MQGKRERRHRLQCLSLVICILALSSLDMLFSPSAVAASSKLPHYIEEYIIPTPSSAPLAITVDTQGVVWFTESNATKLGRFDPSNRTFREYVVPGVGDMWGMTTVRGNVWFTQYSGKGSVNPGGAIVPGGHGRLGRFDPTNGSFSFVEIPGAGAFPMRLVADQQGRVWFTEFLGNKIGVYDQPSDRLTEHSVPTNASGPADLTFDSRGALWFTEAYARKIAKFYPENQSFVEYPFESENPSEIVTSPVGIAVADSGDVWFADHGGNWIAEFNPLSHRLVRYPTHTPSEYAYPLSIPNGLLIDGGGTVWFSEHGGNSIGYLNSQTQTMVEYLIPTGPISTALWIALAPNGDIWFAEWSTNKIGVVHAGIPVPLSLRVSQSHFTIQAGEQTSISLLTKTSQDISGNGTFRYSWPSYNPAEVSVTFPSEYPSLSGLADTAAQAQLKVSEKITPGNYTLGLGLDAGTISVWSMVQTEVVQAGPIRISGFPSSVESAAVVVLLVAALGMLILRMRMRRPQRSEPARGLSVD